MAAVDARYAIVRDQLYQLGFEQPMPLGSLALVSTLLDDLVKTTGNLKRFDEENQQLKKERIAWQLSVEPYKCDNTRLLAECNRLHLDLLRQREDARLQLCSVRHKNRTLETDTIALTEQNAELCAQLADMSAALAASSKTGPTAGRSTDLKRKAFVSTVRSKSVFPDYTRAANKAGTPACAAARARSASCKRSTACSGCGDGPRNDRIVVQRLEDEVQSKTEFVDELRKQLESRDREIVRLTQLLNGGDARSTAALGRDCCFRGVNNLTSDVTTLQQQKLKLQASLQLAVAEQNEAKHRACRLADENRRLEQEAAEMERTMLNVEAEYNKRLTMKEDERSKLRQDVGSAGSSASTSKARADRENDVIQNREVLRRTQEEVSSLQTSLRHSKELCDELSVRHEKLQARHSRLKIKCKQIQEEQLIDRRDIATSPPAIIGQATSDTGLPSIELLQSERDFYQTEYVKLLNRPAGVDGSAAHQLQLLQTELRTKDRLLQDLQHSVSQSQLTKAQLNRAERERTVQIADIEQLRCTCDELREQLRALSEEGARAEQQRAEVQRQNDLMVGENRALCANGTALQATAEMLRERLAEVEHRRQAAEVECARVRTSFEQMKILQEQTEKVLAHRQSALSQRDHQLTEAESRASVDNTARDRSGVALNELRAQLAGLQAQLTTVERQKEQFIDELDTKTERLAAAEASALLWQKQCTDALAQVDVLRRQIDTADNENRNKEGTLRQNSNETDALRRQLAQLVNNHSNAMSENRRLEDELTDCSAEHDATRGRLRACESEVERLKSQLTLFVQKVQKADDMLAQRELDRDKILEEFKCMSLDAHELKDNNQSLEQRATAAQHQLSHAEEQLEAMRTELSERACECERLDRQVTELSRQLALGASELEQCHADGAQLRRLHIDLNAQRELAERLAEEKRLVRAELDECSAIRAQLERDNERLHADVRLRQAGERTAQESSAQVLATARADVAGQRALASKQEGDIMRLRKRIDELQEKRAEDREQAARNETLVQEYRVQIKELRQQLTDKRFAKAHGDGSAATAAAGNQPDYDRYSSL